MQQHAQPLGAHQLFVLGLECLQIRLFSSDLPAQYLVE
jgi:hypothetical protein